MLPVVGDVEEVPKSAGVEIVSVTWKIEYFSFYLLSINKSYVWILLMIDLRNLPLQASNDIFCVGSNALCSASVQVVGKFM